MRASLRGLGASLRGQRARILSSSQRSVGVSQNLRASLRGLRIMQLSVTEPGAIRVTLFETSQHQREHGTRTADHMMPMGYWILSSSKDRGEINSKQKYQMKKMNKRFNHLNAKSRQLLQLLFLATFDDEHFL